MLLTATDWVFTRKTPMQRERVTCDRSRQECSLATADQSLRLRTRYNHIAYRIIILNDVFSARVCPLFAGSLEGTVRHAAVLAAKANIVSDPRGPASSRQWQWQ